MHPLTTIMTEKRVLAVSRCLSNMVRTIGPAVVLTLSVPVHAGQDLRYALDTASSDVSARVGFFGIASKTARFPTLSGSVLLDPARLEDIVLDVTIDARALRAGDGMTLSRLKGPDFFDVDHHPTVRFAGRAMRMTGLRTAEIAGELTARGVTHPQVLAVTFERDPASTGKTPLGLIGRMTIDRRQFGMTAWSAIVSSKVDITIRTRMVPD